MRRIAFFGTRAIQPFRAFRSDAFFDGLKKDYFVGQRCVSCGIANFPYNLACPVCGAVEFDEVALETSGTLFASTIVYSAPGALNRQAPYQIGLIDLPNGQRIQCRLFGRERQTFVPGMTMSLFVAAYEDGPTLAAHPANVSGEQLCCERRLDMPAAGTIPGSFRALVADKRNGRYEAEYRSLSPGDLPSGDLSVRTEMTGLNYKDALAITGKAPICRTFPMVLGIDLVGTVVESRTPRFKPGERILVTGSGLSEIRGGGYSEYQSLPEAVVMPLPASFSAEEAMLVGTAGYTAMLCVMALVEHGLTPGEGPILVTGATGGVGSIALSLLSGRGYRTIAVTGRSDQSQFLKMLGATDVASREDVASRGKALDRERWMGVVDVAGGKMLADAISLTRYVGIVACCGMAAGGEVPTTVYPFILRGVTLKGVDSVAAPMDLRIRAWRNLEKELDRGLLRKLGVIRPFVDLPILAQDLLSGKLRGRVAIALS